MRSPYRMFILKWKVASVVSSSLQPYVLQPARLLCPWDSPGKNTGVGCHFLLQGLILTEGLNQGLLHCRKIFYCLSHRETLHIQECSSVQFSHSVVFDSLQPHELQHAMPPCPSSTPRIHPNHVHCVGDAIQPSHPLSSPSPALNISQHQGLFQWVSFSHQVAKVLEFQLQHQSFQWTFRTDFL